MSVYVRLKHIGANAEKERGMCVPECVCVVSVCAWLCVCVCVRVRVTETRHLDTSLPWGSRLRRRSKGSFRIGYNGIGLDWCCVVWFGVVVVWCCCGLVLCGNNKTLAA